LAGHIAFIIVIAKNRSIGDFALNAQLSKFEDCLEQ
jgi:hypothetical protein